jgi:hypothetical protein
LVGKDYYVEFVTLNKDTDISTCVQLRTQESSSTLQRREWAQGSTPPGTWRTVIENVVPAAPLSPSTPVKAPAVGSVSPFVVEAANATFMFQKLQVNLQIKIGTNERTNSRRQLSVTFTALNSPPTGSVPEVCNEGRNQ